jgi:hypothetical protein
MSRIRITIRSATSDAPGPRYRVMISGDAPHNEMVRHEVFIRHSSFRLLLILALRKGVWVDCDDLAQHNTGRYIHRLCEEMGLKEPVLVMNNRQKSYRLNTKTVRVEFSAQVWRDLAVFPDADVREMFGRKDKTTKRISNVKQCETDVLLK